MITNKTTILAHYLLAVFKGCLVTEEEPHHTPIDLAKEEHYVWNLNINYRCTDHLVYLVNTELFGHKFADYIDDHNSCNTCFDNDADNALDLDEIMLTQDDSDCGDTMSECNYSEAINQRAGHYVKGLKHILSDNDYQKMKSLVSYDNFDYVYSTNYIPSDKLVKLIAQMKPTAFKNYDQEVHTKTKHMNYSVGGFISCIVIILIAMGVIGSHMNNTTTKSAPKSTVQRYINRHYGTYHLPYKVNQINYDKPSQTVFFDLTNYASKHYSAKTNTDLMLNFKQIANNSSNNHIGFMLKLKNGRTIVLKRNPSQQRQHNKQIAKLEAKEHTHEQSEQRHRTTGIFIPPAR